ncbi:MAG: tRNA (adenosine(37)-N6)-threonylcarbamoyltransferase complex dimerization subunit type 1 TsaB [Bacteroidia bacterium]
MSLLLHLETATTVCSVALSENGKLLVFEEINNGYTHAENLTVFIENILRQTQKKNTELDAIAVSKGPGSYTGLRIGVATAKGLCYALNKPLIAINTLEAMTVGITPKEENALYCPMIDARRMEVYCALFDAKNNWIKNTSAEIISENSFSEFLSSKKIFFYGDGAAKCKTTLSHHKNVAFLETIFPSAKNMIALAHAAFDKNNFEDLAYFEPFYLKEFVAGGTK